MQICYLECDLTFPGIPYRDGMMERNDKQDRDLGLGLGGWGGDKKYSGKWISSGQTVTASSEVSREKGSRKRALFPNVLHIISH